MTANEQKLLNAAQSLTEAGNTIADGVQALKNKIAELQGVEVEDLSDEFATLDSAVANISAIGSAMTPAPPGTPASGGDGGGGAQPIDGTLPTSGPMDHPEIAPDPIGGTPTDAGVPTSVSQPGTGGNTEDTPATPLAEDAQSEANPTVAPNDGTADSTGDGGAGTGGTDPAESTPDEDVADGGTDEDEEFDD